LLAVTIPDLKPNAQDTSAFYLENIYQLLANPNASVGSIPSTLAKPPPFSPPKYIVWVNSLWLSALLLSLWGATMATLERQFVSRHISITQNKEHLPANRARIHAMLANRPHAFTTLRRPFGLFSTLHLSLFLFFAGLLIYFFNISRATSGALFYLILSFTCSYTVFSVMPIIRSSELFYTPLSPFIFSVYLDARYTIPQKIPRPLRLLNSVRVLSVSGEDTIGGLLQDKIRWTEQKSSEPSQDIDAEVLGRMLIVVDQDDELEKLFDAIPGFCDSELVQKPLLPRVTTKLQRSLDGLLDRTFSSYLVTESVRNDRLIICLDAAHSALGPNGVSEILDNFFRGRRDEALKSVEIGHSLVRWGHSRDVLIEPTVRRIVACIIAHPQDRDDRWAKLVNGAFDIPDGVIRDYLAHRDSVLLAILIHITRKALLADRLEQRVLEALSRFDISNASAELRHDFCALWNQIVQEARNKGAESTPTQFLTGIRPLFAALHQGTDSAPIRFAAHVSDDGHVLSWAWSYRPCIVASHHPDSTADYPATTSRNLTSHTTLQSQHPLPASRNVATENATAGNAHISVTNGIADPVRGSDSGGNSVLQRVEEAGIMPDPLVLDSLPTPIATPVLSSDSVVLAPSIDHALMQTDHDRRSLGAPSSTSTTVPLSIAPQVSTVSDEYPAIRDGASGAQYDNQDTHLFILSEDHRQSPPGGVTGL
jgi:hypothetical protein